MDLNLLYDFEEESQSNELETIQLAMKKCLAGLKQYVEEAIINNDNELYSESVLNVAYMKKIMISLDKVHVIYREYLASEPENIPNLNVIGKINEILDSIEHLDITPEESITIMNNKPSQKEKQKSDGDERIGW